MHYMEIQRFPVFSPERGIFSGCISIAICNNQRFTTTAMSVCLSGPSESVTRIEGACVSPQRQRIDFEGFLYITHCNTTNARNTPCTSTEQWHLRSIPHVRHVFARYFYRGTNSFNAIHDTREDQPKQ